MTNCCDACASVSRRAEMRLQKYIQELHTHIHDIEQKVDSLNHLQKRHANSTPEVHAKTKTQLGAFVNDFKTLITKFKTAYESPYFNKVAVHYPELAKVLLRCKNKILNSREIKNLHKS